MSVELIIREAALADTGRSIRCWQNAVSRHTACLLQFSTDAGAFWSRQGFRKVPVPELVAALPDAPQVRHYEQQGWLPDEVAWCKVLFQKAQ
ncbi:MAG: hypothetical protein ABI862_19335 [Ilumatobacteraceae bacterium]